MPKELLTVAQAQAEIERLDAQAVNTNPENLAEIERLRDRAEDLAWQVECIQRGLVCIGDGWSVDFP